jgi:hypothetical protein
MSQSKNQAAIQAAYDITSIMMILRTAREQCKAFNDKYTSEAYNTTWNNMSTAALNADGTMGTPDSTPVVTNPITQGNIYRSATQLINGVTCLQEFLNFVGNTAVTTADYSKIIDDLAS